LGEGAEAVRSSADRGRTLRTRHRTFDVPVRESTRSRTLRVTVGPDHPLEVVVPVGTGDRAIDRFLREKRDWIARNVAAAEAIAARPGRLGLEQRGVMFVHGEPVPVARVRNRRPVARLARGKVVVGGSPAQAQAAMERLYRRLARDAVSETAEHESRRLGLTYRAIGIGDQRTLWGSCSPRGRLSFSWRLMLAPREVLDYVVVHELCHLRHAHHRRSFWQMVEAAYPGYREQERWLREHGRELQRYGPAV
jgi:predicted metal-dependent hydrolase